MKKGCCSRVGCTEKAKRHCKTCKIAYCSQQCQKACWPIHKRFCASSYLEKLIKYIHDQQRECFGFYNTFNRWTQIENTTWESVISVDDHTNTYDQNFVFCVFCQSDRFFNRRTLLAVNAWPEMLYGDYINASISICVECEDKTHCMVCALPHDESQLCPVQVRWALLIHALPWLEDVPDVALRVLRKHVRANFIDYLINW